MTTPKDGATAPEERFKQVKQSARCLSQELLLANNGTTLKAREKLLQKTLSQQLISNATGNEAHEKLRQKARKSLKQSSMQSIKPFSYTGNNSKKFKFRFRLTPKRKFYLLFLILPTIISLWYAAAILFPPSWHEAAPSLIWTPSAQTRGPDGEFILCPRPSICSEGTFQVILISVARLTAFASYVVQGLVFCSKMHSTIHFLSGTYAASIIPFESFHHVHALTGSTYAILAFLHTLAHFIRWGVRQELAVWCESQVGLSGIFAILAMLGIVFVMGPGRKISKFAFESRFLTHQVFFWILTIALCFHVERTRVITLIYFVLWLLDWLYGMIYRTYRLDMVEFSPLPDKSGVQMLWKNPRGFETKSGEFVRVCVPWLHNGGEQWHPFSIYLQEATEKGLEEVNRRDHTERVFVGEESKGGREIELGKTALLLIEFQNEFCHPNGKLYDGVKDVLASTNAIGNVKNLVEIAKKEGVHIIHAPITMKESGENNPNSGLGILKDVHDGRFFSQDSWGAEFIDSLMPQSGDKIVERKHGLDCFPGSNLQEIIVELGVETLVIGGLLTNCCVESTMRTAYEKGLNVITLVDGTACKSKAEQEAACNTTFKMFSTPMTCKDFADICNGTMDSNTLKKTGVEIETQVANELDDSEDEAETSLEEFAEVLLSNPYNEDVSALVRRGFVANQTTQVFIMPAGDWTKGLAEQVAGRSQKRSCWVRGPYTSPYFVASDFSHSVLMASGIGITPALGILGQFSGASKTKVVVWSVRSKNMLKFFAPLMKEAHIAAIYYTGKDKFTNKELKRIRSYGNIYVQQSRPKSLVEVIASLIVLFERKFLAANVMGLERDVEDLQVIQSICTMNDLPKEIRRTWVLLYCGGSTRIRDELAEFAHKSKIGWQAELFDW